jgi:hypothetical protein
MAPRPKESYHVSNKIKKKKGKKGGQGPAWAVKTMGDDDDDDDMAS